MKGVAPKPLRCAIYTRVSTDHGLEQEFNSLDNQREAAEAYVKSQAQEGWRLIRDRYDDGGFSGGTWNGRPCTAARRHPAHRIDIIVVYKVDRLTRSLADFAKLVELFDAHSVSFVSVTQSFNTTTSMGRLTLNVLLSFAQFEREVTGERIRDKIAASKKKGMWVGGVVPLGYALHDRKLVIDAAEAATVQLVFERYLALGSLSLLQRDLRDRNIVTRARRWPQEDSRRRPAHQWFAQPYAPQPDSISARSIIESAVIRGEHAPIIDRDLFEKVQTKLNENRTHEGCDERALKPCCLAVSMTTAATA